MFSVLLLATLSLFLKLIYSGVWLSLSLPTQIIPEVQTTTDRKAKIQTHPESTKFTFQKTLLEM